MRNAIQGVIFDGCWRIILGEMLNVGYNFAFANDGKWSEDVANVSPPLLAKAPVPFYSHLQALFKRGLLLPA